jgi:hypothetical protein
MSHLQNKLLLTCTAVGLMVLSDRAGAQLATNQTNGFGKSALTSSSSSVLTHPHQDTRQRGEMRQE